MSGIYIHIPFCKKACNYCNFHFSTSLRTKRDLLDALKKEILLQKNYLENDKISTIYFGGGTPSLLSAAELNEIFETIFKIHAVSDNPEITLEANPDDLTRLYLDDLKKNTPINRFSIGVQSFFDEDLIFMNRAHNAAQADTAIKYAQDIGFKNLTIDLIYGVPTSDNQRWKENLDKALTYNLPHISSYALTVESGTALYSQIKKKKVAPVDDEKTAQQFDILVQSLRLNGYEQYEISNFAREGKRAQHNSNYWLGEKYLGIGPSAHSFNSVSRQWNVANNPDYIKSLVENKIPMTIEILTPDQSYNEYVLTRLRTVWGCNIQEITEKFGKKYEIHLNKISEKFIECGWITKTANIYTLTDPGKLMADFITRELFFEE